MAGTMTASASMARSSRSPLGGRQLVLVLAVIVLATVVVPPLAAWRINARRVRLTSERATQAAERMRAGTDRVERLSRDVDVTFGPGRLPKTTGAAAQEAWLSHAVLAPAVFGDGMPTDAWGQCFLMNVGEWRRGGRVWILSSGPNGLIDTPFGATKLAGDDIGAIVK